MNFKQDYVDLLGNTHDLSELDADERRVLDQLWGVYQASPQWHDFEKQWMTSIRDLSESQGLPTAKTPQTTLYQVAQDLGNRLAVHQGKARLPDYRDELADFVRRHFKSRREFCQATGLSEAMLSHVLNRRKHIAIDTLEQALAKVGYTLHIQANGAEPVGL